MGNRYRSDGSFPLRDMLVGATPIETKPDGSNVYAARQVLGVDVEQLIYFAASLFWRAGVADWKVKFADAPKIDIDPSLMTALQQYLLALSPFPSQASIFVAVDATTAPWRAMWSPIKQNDRPQLRYSLYIPGIIMELGVDLPPALRVPSISDATEIIVLSDVVYKYVAAIGASLSEGSALSKSLARHFPSGRS
ncbi:MAG: hypothetical protein JWQ49_2966 [Edaphobacter sp.]|nr:hypothetical protein [Edaphobacter sp.]